MEVILDDDNATLISTEDMTFLSEMKKHLEIEKRRFKNVKEKCEHIKACICNNPKKYVINNGSEV